MKVGTFFSGVGSPEQALKNLAIKHQIEFACDIDKYAKQTYLKNFKPKLFATDITALDMTDLPYVDLLVFGFPCQAFSMAGKRGGFDDTRGTLFYDALRYLKEHRPRYFIAENVKGLLSHDNGKTFQTIIDCLAKTTNYQMSLMPFENLGYHIHYKVLNTKDFGLPQNRERIFIIGIRDDEDNNFNFPKEIPLELKLKDILQDNPNSKFYLTKKNLKTYDRNFGSKGKILKGENNSPALTSAMGAGGGNVPAVEEKYYLSDEKIKKLQEYSKRQKENGNGFTAKFHNTETENMSTLKASYQGVDDLIITHCLQKRSAERPSIKKDKNAGGTGHLKKEDGTTYCLDTGNTQAVEYSNKIRRLTPIECERLQGFKDNFTEGVSDTQRYKQMGNTITVNVIQEIIKNLI